MTAMAGMVIIGAGECGGRAALALRDLGYDGPVTLVGDEPHPPYERPPLSKDAMTGEAPSIKAIASDALFAERAIRHIHSVRAVAIDRAAHVVHLSDGSSLPYNKLLLATGSVPRQLPMTGLGSRCVYLRTFNDALAIRAHLSAGNRVAIIGGGFIGLELAASARKLGATVTVIEAQPRILMRGVPAEIAEIIHKAHEAEGVPIRTGQGIAAIADDGKDVAITLADGQKIVADLAVIGIGAVPVTALAAEAGLAIDNGIAVDERLRTADPDIFAAGDCCSFPLGIYGGRRVRLEAWRNAQEQGALAAKNMLGADEAHAAVPWFWSDQYGLTLQIAGLSDEGKSVVRRDLDDGAFILFHLAQDGRLIAASGIGPGNAVARDIRLAEMLIAKRGKPAPEALGSQAVKLKSLLAA
ncbi:MULTISPECIES: FAD-dependent oxidoreductase [unclassified Mesorhizobium]|uniref:NAD(P)/FAD-dependent oxidoreductase n=1 Tax=unclassified Mesorhizobium TaxID=325217 RepID=UPI000F76243D|nr:MULTISPECIES: FAD-dependent oxidoreductase [unclassified Mesorhizobium]AZO04487.1 ferredoxin reductase [Mesorhizobium sp. M2A.F.Ca.ET.043.02.1.1]RUW42454.1 ferredoxin reductase [Mesorhizobium sp. M2A.F.Ca.ET.015.02.1.1]RVC91212.1 ferredoxin reductase [Mesorhizobium sp. M2A.F.Ca.ET.017.03.2.1]RVC99086.1 ferredoxin reductase [Mesorhizobium sp. M2A.F.Ca.ET.029.05.1.1]RWB45347.1 MAG: ferredoxin reductase [Mesorhizobium sp.]